MVPFDTESPFITSGIRVGTPAITSRGVKEAEIPKIVELIDRALMNREQVSEISSLRKEVKELMGSRPLFTWE
jgi:glycine hydroxymethyltransferase